MAENGAVTTETLAALMRQGFDHIDHRMDGIETELRHRPTREEMTAVARATALEAATEALQRRGSSPPRSAWWEQWGRTMATILGVVGAVGAGLAALWQTIRGGAGP